MDEITKQRGFIKPGKALYLVGLCTLTGLCLGWSWLAGYEAFVVGVFTGMALLVLSIISHRQYNFLEDYYALPKEKTE